MADDDEIQVVPRDDDALREMAVRGLKAKSDVKIHAVVYVLVNLLLVVIWLVSAWVSGEWFPWFLFPLCGWGVGLGIHAWTVYGQRSITEDDVRREMDKLRGKV